MQSYYSHYEQCKNKNFDGGHRVIYQSKGLLKRIINSVKVLTLHQLGQSAFDFEVTKNDTF